MKNVRWVYIECRAGDWLGVRWGPVAACLIQWTKCEQGIEIRTRLVPVGEPQADPVPWRKFEGGQ